MNTLIQKKIRKEWKNEREEMEEKKYRRTLLNERVTSRVIQPLKHIREYQFPCSE